MKPTILRRLALPAICLVILLGGSSRALAHGPNGTLSEQGYREMRRLNHLIKGLFYLQYLVIDRDKPATATSKG